VRSSLRRHERESFYKYTDARAAQLILRNRSLRWSAPSRFNDPLDVAREWALDFTPVELQETMKDGVIELLEGKRSTSVPALQLLAHAFQAEQNAERRAYLATTLRRSLNDVKPASTTAFDEFKRAWAEMVPLLRILCLSEIPDSLPMWAHYADQHRGVVLELTVSDERDSSWLLAQPVIYSDTPPRLPSKEVWAKHLLEGVAVNWSEWFREYHYVKTTDWSYECEWRVMTYARDDDTSDHSDILFHPADLARLYLGKDIPPEDRASLMGLLTGELAHVEVMQGTFEHAARRLRFQRSR
jgi:hypothetical protein